MTRNVELLQRVMQQIIDDPGHHDQRNWVTPFVHFTPDGGTQSCGTAYCFAGWTHALTGLSNDEIQELETFPDASTPWDQYWNMLIATRATEKLGITEEESRTLFHPLNTPRMLELMVKDLCNGAPLLHEAQYRAMEDEEKIS